jgi:hypothetical protein
MKLVSGLSVFTFLFASYFLVSQKATFTNATSIIDKKRLSLLRDSLRIRKDKFKSKVRYSGI